MQEQIHLNINDTNLQNLDYYTKVLKTDTNTLFNSALEFYFQKVEEELSKELKSDESQNTNLDYDEFWDGVDLD